MLDARFLWYNCSNSVRKCCSHGGWLTYMPTHSTVKRENVSILISITKKKTKNENYSVLFGFVYLIIFCAIL